MDKVLFSSKSNEWATPTSLFEKLNRTFNFTLDPCSTDENHKCDNYYTKENNGLVQDWSGESVFVNPPYGRQIGKWIEKSFNESRKKGTLVVCLIPARTDTIYWHTYCMRAHEIYFIKGRIKFENKEHKPSPAPFPSAVVVFKPELTPIFTGGNFPKIHSMNLK
jgi:phage N-6-adenine-methyltransferase